MNFVLVLFAKFALQSVKLHDFWSHIEKWPQIIKNLSQDCLNCCSLKKKTSIKYVNCGSLNEKMSQIVLWPFFLRGSKICDDL